MAFQAPNLQFIDPGTPYSDAASMFLASARAAQSMRLARQQAELRERQQREEERRNREVEGRERIRVSLEGRRVGVEEGRFGEEKRKSVRQEKREDVKTETGLLAQTSELLNPASPLYNPALAENVIRAHGGTYTPPADASAPAPRQPPVQAPAPSDGPPVHQMPSVVLRASTPDPPYYAPASIPGEDEPPPPPGAPQAPQPPGPPPAAGQPPGRQPARVSIGGREYTIDPEAAESGRQAFFDRRAQQIDNLAAVDTSPFRGQYFKTIANMVRNRTLDPAEAADMAKFFLTTESMEARAQMMAQARAREAAARQQMARAGLGMRAEGLTNQNVRDYELAKQRFATRFELPGTLSAHKELSKTLTDLGDLKDVNPLAFQQALYNLIRSFQPGDPRISNADYQSINQSALSVLGRVENWASVNATSKPGRTKLLKVYEQLVRNHNAASARIKAARTAFDTTYGPGSHYWRDPSVATQIQRDRQAMFGDILGGQAPAVTPNPRLPQAPPKPHARQGGSVSGSVTVPADQDPVEALEQVFELPNGQRAVIVDGQWKILVE